MKLSFELVQHAGVRAYGPALAALERSITYPLDDDRFYVDHGRDYGRFLDELGDAWFLVVLDGSTPVGLIAGAIRSFTRPDGRVLCGLYVADLKLAPQYRGGRVSRRLFARGLRLLLTHPAARGVRVVFGAGMHGPQGDVRKSFRRRGHVGRLGRSWAELQLFFVPPEALRALEGPGPGPMMGGFDLSGDPTPLVRRNTGVKDFRLVSTGAPWKLAHIPRGPQLWDEGLGTLLRAAAEEIDEDELACFALDATLTGPLGWLASRGLVPTARCRVLGLAHPFLGRAPLARPSWFHLSTAEI